MVFCAEIPGPTRRPTPGGAGRVFPPHYDEEDYPEQYGSAEQEAEEELSNSVGERAPATAGAGRGGGLMLLPTLGPPSRGGGNVILPDGTRGREEESHSAHHRLLPRLMVVLGAAALQLSLSRAL